ncbi:unnamed protein product [Microthlaspi erraticum]|uniref:Uncharacterized protein n=1 Tax=Microthlaspi erraticum TaxID=1685480 RepID=A0A6D2IQX7_9BRAS|nr:unnamed protein product [Microthlaspi erraticum]
MFWKSKKNNQDKKIDDTRKSIKRMSKIVEFLVKLEKRYVDLADGCSICSGHENEEVMASTYLTLKDLYDQIASLIEVERELNSQAMVGLEEKIEALKIQTKAKQNWMNLIICGKLLPKQQDNKPL